MIMALAAMGALATQANAVTFDFIKCSNVKLGPTSTFTVGFLSDASGFPPQAAYGFFCKFTLGNPSERDWAQTSIVKRKLIPLISSSLRCLRLHLAIFKCLLASVQFVNRRRFFSTLHQDFTGAHLSGRTALTAPLLFQPATRRVY